MNLMLDLRRNQDRARLGLGLQRLADLSHRRFERRMMIAGHGGARTRTATRSAAAASA